MTWHVQETVLSVRGHMDCEISCETLEEIDSGVSVPLHWLEVCMSLSLPFCGHLCDHLCVQMPMNHHLVLCLDLVCTVLRQYLQADSFHLHQNTQHLDGRLDLEGEDGRGVEDYV